jgi:hypothetical protein
VSVVLPADPIVNDEVIVLVPIRAVLGESGAGPSELAVADNGSRRDLKNFVS